MAFIPHFFQGGQKQIQQCCWRKTTFGSLCFGKRVH